MKAVILAWGNSAHNDTLNIKTDLSMLKVGGITILEHQILLLKKYNITDIYIPINLLKNTIVQDFGDGNEWDVKINYFEQLDSVSIAESLENINNLHFEDFLILNSNVMINMHLGRLINFHFKKDSDCTLVLHPSDQPFENNLVEIDRDHRITHFFNKPHTSGQYYPNLQNAGVVIFSSEVFKILKKVSKAFLSVEYLTSLLDDFKMFGYNTSEYLKELNTSEDIRVTELDWNSGKIEASSYEHKQKAIFLDRDGVINEESSYISKPEDLRIYHFTSSAIRKINKSDYKAIIISNQSVIARNLCTLKELSVIHNKMETELGKDKAKIDAIYFCPHHPEKGNNEEFSEFQTDCVCRKPKPGMLLEAAADFNIDLASSFMIGDNGRDIEAGRNAGCVTVGVRTGYAMRKTICQPDFIFENLEEAVDFIVSEPYSEIYERIKLSLTKIPDVIAIGGNSFAGKSTLVSYLKYKFEKDGRKVFKIDLDHWILPEENRKQFKNITDKFRINDVERDIQQILAGIGLRVQKHTNHSSKDVVSYKYRYKGEDIILIEGVVALNSEVIRNLSQLKVFVEISQSEHYERLKKYFQWTGKPQIEIESIYNELIIKEYQTINNDNKFADFVVNSTTY